MCLPYAKCVDDKELSTFSCICNEKYFTNGSFTSLDVEAGGTNKNAIKYECKRIKLLIFYEKKYFKIKHFFLFD
jgi:hypothetical protein